MVDGCAVDCLVDQQPQILFVLVARVLGIAHFIELSVRIVRELWDREVSLDLQHEAFPEGVLVLELIDLVFGNFP